MIILSVIIKFTNFGIQQHPAESRQQPPGLENVQGVRRGGGSLTGSGEGTDLFYILAVECSLNCIYHGCVTGTID